MTRVLVDLLFFTGTKGGMESYVREIYSRMGPARPDLELVGLASRELLQSGAPWFPGELVDSGVSGENRLAWAGGELLAVARAARRLDAELVHAPANFGPLRSRIPVVTTIHDLLPFRHPEYVPGPYATVVRAMNRIAVRASSRVLTISHATARDLERHLHVPAERIDVVPLAGSGTPDTAAGPPRRDDLLLSVGNRMPHKNFEALLEALALIPSDRRPRLIIPGSHGPDPLAPLVARLGLDAWVELPGWVDRSRLDELYASATAFVFPTRFEGFGLPPLDAMCRGCPVIASDIPVLREVAGEAAAYVDTRDPAALARTIESVLGDPAARERMTRAGLERAALFSWERTMRGTVQSFERALSA